MNILKRVRDWVRGTEESLEDNSGSVTVYLEQEDDPYDPLTAKEYRSILLDTGFSGMWCSTGLNYQSTVPLYSHSRKPITDWMEKVIISGKNLSLTHEQFMIFKYEEIKQEKIGTIDLDDIKIPRATEFLGCIMYETLSGVFIIQYCEYCGTKNPGMENSGCSKCGARFEYFKLEELDELT